MILAVLPTRSKLVLPDETIKIELSESKIWYSMMLMFIRRFAAIVVIVCFAVLSQAQSVRSSMDPKKPYKILTSGKQITVKSSKNIKNVMVWTSSGHRIVEQREINEPSFSFSVNVGEKVFFLMIQFEGSRPYTEKIGI